MNTVDPRLSGPGLYYPAPRLHTGADTGGGLISACGGFEEGPELVCSVAAEGVG